MKQRTLTYTPLAELVPNVANPKNHASGIADSFARFGFLEPVVVDERTGQLIAGHGRLENLTAAHASGAKAPEGIRVRKGEWLVPVVRGWASADDREANAALVALNRLIEKGGWDDGRLLDTLARLGDGAAGLFGVGFTGSDLDDIFARHQEAMPAAPPEPGADWGDLGDGRQVRTVMLDFALDDYRFVAETAARARPHYHVDSNADLFAALLEEWAAEQPAGTAAEGGTR